MMTNEVGELSQIIYDQNIYIAKLENEYIIICICKFYFFKWISFLQQINLLIYKCLVHK